MSRKTIPPAHIEDHLNQLKNIVEKMEQKNLPLEESLAQFEQGIRLVRESQKILTAAEQKISILLNKDGQIERVPFEEDVS